MRDVNEEKVLSKLLICLKQNSIQVNDFCKTCKNNLLQKKNPHTNDIWCLEMKIDKRFVYSYANSFF